MGSSGADVAGRRWAREAWGVGLVVVGVESGVCVCVVAMVGTWWTLGAGG